MIKPTFNQAKWVAYLVFSLLFMILIKPDVLAIGGDGAGYLRAIQSDKTSSWHSALFLHELRLTKCIIGNLLTGFVSFISFFINTSAAQALECKISAIDTGLQAIRIIWAACALLLFATLLKGFQKLIFQDHAHVASLLIFSLFLLFIREYRYFFFMKYLDSYFCSMGISAIIILYLSKHSTNNKRVFLCCIASILIIHCILYRHNAFLLLPVYTYLGALWLLPQHNKRKRLTWAAAGAFLLFAAAMGINNLLPQVKEMHPASVMLLSEVKITSIISGEKNIMDSLERKIPDHSPSKEHIAPEYGINGLPNDHEWEEMLQTFKGLAISHPKELVISHCIQIAQFLCDGHVPRPFRKIVCNICPAAPSPDDKAWEWRPISYHSSGGRYEKIPLYLTCLAFLCYGLTRRHALHQDYYSLANGLGFLALYFCLCYFIVTPTPDTRYHAFSVMCACLSISLYSGPLLIYKLYPFFRKKIGA